MHGPCASQTRAPGERTRRGATAGVRRCRGEVVFVPPKDAGLRALSVLTLSFGRNRVSARVSHRSWRI